jgi:hypothetical protein
MYGNHTHHANHAARRPRVRPPLDPTCGAAVVLAMMTAGTFVSALKAMRDAVGATVTEVRFPSTDRCSQPPNLLEPDVLETETEYVGQVLRLVLRGALDRASIPRFVVAFTACVELTPARIEVDTRLARLDIEGARVLALAGLESVTIRMTEIPGEPVAVGATRS